MAMGSQIRYSLEDIENLFFDVPCGVGVFDRETKEPLFLNDAFSIWWVISRPNTWGSFAVMRTLFSLKILI